MGQSIINGSFSMAILTNQRVYLAAVRSCLHRRSPRSHGFMANWLSAVCVIARDVVLQRPWPSQKHI